MAEFDIGSPSFSFHQITSQQPSEADGQNPNQLFRKINEQGSPSRSGDLASRKRRGRPLGAKNKLKSPNFIIQESPNAIRAHLLEVRSGSDVFESLVAYARKKQQGICVLSATGRVSSVTLRNPAVAGAEILPLQGQFEIVFLSGNILPSPVQARATALTVFLAMGGAQIMGGNVFGPLIAYGPVTVVATTFNVVACESLPLEIDEQQRQTEPSFSSDGIGGGSGNFSPDPSSSGFPFLNMPAQLHVDGWTGGQAPY